MRRLLAPRKMSAAAVAMLLLLIAGAGYALASSNKTIHACVHHKGGDIYIAKKCAKHDKKISWNKVGPRGATGATGATGPQGPGATDVVYNAQGGTSSTPVTIGTIGPWTVGFTCMQSGSTTTATAYFTGPGGSLNGIDAGPSSAISVSEVFPQLSNDELNTASSTSANSTSSASLEALFVPSSGTSYEVTATTAATGSTTDTCHFAATATPASSAASASAAVARDTKGRVAPLSRPRTEPLIPERP
jgi:hypothetical protein